MVCWHDASVLQRASSIAVSLARTRPRPRRPIARRRWVYPLRPAPGVRSGLIWHVAPDLGGASLAEVEAAAVGTIVAARESTSHPGSRVAETSSGPSGAQAQVPALLHECRRQAPDQVGTFLRLRVAQFGMRDLSVYVSDVEQRNLVPIVALAASTWLDLDASTGGRCSRPRSRSRAHRRGLWSAVMDGAACLGVICVTVFEVDDGLGRWPAAWPGWLPPFWSPPASAPTRTPLFGGAGTSPWRLRCKGACSHP
jgi:hypothetical protein